MVLGADKAQVKHASQEECKVWQRHQQHQHEEQQGRQPDEEADMGWLGQVPLQRDKRDEAKRPEEQENKDGGRPHELELPCIVATPLR